MTRRTYAALFDAAARQLDTGHSVILDATFGKQTLRNALYDHLAREDVSCYFIEATASGTTLKRRLVARDRNLDEISDARLEDFETLNKLYEPPDELDASRCLTVTTETALDETLVRCLTGLVERHVDRT